MAPCATRGHGTGCRQESHMNHVPLFFVLIFFAVLQFWTELCCLCLPFRQQRGDGARQHPPAQLCHLRGRAWWQHQPQIRFQGNSSTAPGLSACAARVGFWHVNIWYSQSVVTYHMQQQAFFLEPYNIWNCCTTFPWTRQCHSPPPPPRESR